MLRDKISILYWGDAPKDKLPLGTTICRYWANDKSNRFYAERVITKVSSGIVGIKGGGLDKWNYF
jgi:hypothetical protein